MSKMTEPVNRTQPFIAQHLVQLHDSNVVYSSDPTTILGAGGFGVVHKAIDSVTQEVLAVKRVQHAPDPPSGNNSNELAKDNLDREHKAIRALRGHRNIVTIHSVETKPMETLIVMEYLADGNLKKLINEEGPFGAGRIAQIAVQICNGLNVLHNHISVTDANGTKQVKSIIHCDLKPENILVDLKRNTFKICDFGLAHTTQRSVTYQTSVCGTWNYMAPEQFQIGAELTVKTDVYGLGAVMWHMATKTAPWGDLHMSEICRQMTTKEAGHSGRLAFVSEDRNVMQGFDADLAKLIYDCTNPEAAKRPTLQEVTKKLQEVLQANPMSPANFNVSAGYDTDSLPVLGSTRTNYAHVGEDGITSLKLQQPKNDEYRE